MPSAGSTIHSFRFEAAFDCQVEQLMAIAREFDLMSHWNKCAYINAVPCDHDHCP